MMSGNTYTTTICLIAVYTTKDLIVSDACFVRCREQKSNIEIWSGGPKLPSAIDRLVFAHMMRQSNAEAHILTRKLQAAKTYLSGGFLN